MTNYAELPPNPTVCRVDGLLTAALGNELLMMSVSHGKYFNLNDVGARIWELLAVPTTVDELVTALTLEYDIDDDTARREVDAFLAALRERELLTPGQAAIA